MLTVLEIGTEVTVLGGSDGQVTAVMIEDGASISYKVAYWNAGKLEHDWVPSL